MLPIDDLAALNKAADLLNAVGRRADHSRVAIRCLLAAESLRRAGARIGVLPIAVTNHREAIGTALRYLGGIEDDTLDDEDVTDAVQYALLAHVAAR